MQQNPKSLLAPALLAVLLILGCSRGDKLPGRYVVVGVDKTVAAITNVGVGYSNQVSLEEYREQIRKQYSEKTLEFTSKPPPAFLIPVPLTGTVQGNVSLEPGGPGRFTGGWMRDEKDRSAILIYQWISGSMYLLWGRGSLSNAVLRVEVDRPGSNTFVLHLKKLR